MDITSDAELISPLHIPYINTECHGYLHKRYNTHTHTHTAQGTSPQFIDQPTNVTAFGSATIQCSALGSPQPSISWFKDGTPITPSPRITVDSVGHLQIANLQNTDEGGYHCVATNVVGSVQSSVGRLSIACKFKLVCRCWSCFKSQEAMIKDLWYNINRGYYI